MARLGQTLFAAGLALTAASVPSPWEVNVHHNDRDDTPHTGQIAKPWITWCPAGESQSYYGSHNCIPTASAHDMYEGGITDYCPGSHGVPTGSSTASTQENCIKQQIYLVESDSGDQHYQELTLSSGELPNYLALCGRCQIRFEFEAFDGTGNMAKKVVNDLVLDDKTKPTVADSCPETVDVYDIDTMTCSFSATDNIDQCNDQLLPPYKRCPSLVYLMKPQDSDAVVKVAEGALLSTAKGMFTYATGSCPHEMTCNKTFIIEALATDHAGKYGANGTSNSVAFYHSVTLTNVQTDCYYGSWSDWGQCSTTCGPGTMTRTRLTRAPTLNGAPCGKDTDTKSCNEYNDCPYHCQVTNFDDWTDCSASCCSSTTGCGTQRRHRTITNHGSKGGYVCPYLWESRECNTSPCPIDCEWGNWGNWADCDVSCGGGNAERLRSVEIAAKNGGRACVGSESELQACNEHNCPTDCDVGNWQLWNGGAGCPKSCGGGEMTRQRENVVEYDGGKQCPHSTETKQCNTFPCPIDCETSLWYDYTECSRSCGPGTKTQKKDVQQASHYGGAECGDLERVINCNLGECPAHCLVSEFSAWSDCEVSCGGGHKSRTRSIVDANLDGGYVCPFLEEKSTCAEFHCPINCEHGSWGTWTDCSHSCATEYVTPSKTRSRQHQIPRHGGAECTFSVSETATCNGYACPVNCELKNWEGWSDCPSSCTSNDSDNTQTRTRDVLTPAANGGKECAHQAETQQCNTHNCPEDCQLSGWQAWSDCSLSCRNTGAYGIQTRTRFVRHAAKYGGDPCHPTLRQELNCNDFPCPIDCSVKPWSPLTSCSHSCNSNDVSERPSGRGFKTMTILHAKHGGDEASCQNQMETYLSSMPGTEYTLTDAVTTADTTELTVYVVCNNFPCPIDCELSSWTAWSPCSMSCEGGKKTRSRVNTGVDAAHGGALCSDRLEESAPCNESPCPIDCQLSAWSEWGQCDRSCGDEGQREKTRNQVGGDAQHGGAPCSTELTRVGECNRQPCPEHCQVTAFGPWTDCSATCHTGLPGSVLPTTFRARTIMNKDTASAHGYVCPYLQETKTCNTHLCPTDCVLGDWGSFDACDVSCGQENGGTQNRYRKITPARNGGKVCHESELNYHTRACNTHDCPQDCKWGNWDTWSDCLTTCGNLGTQTRARVHSQMVGNGGVPCVGVNEETKNCNRFACPRDCQEMQQGFSDDDLWNPWMSVSGDNNRLRRTRKDGTTELNGGKKCNEYEQFKDYECVEDSTVGAWGACQKGYMVRSRTHTICSKKAALQATISFTQMKHCETQTHY